MKAQEPASALAERGETLQVLRQAVGELPEEERLPVELCFFEGLSVADTARGLDLPRETARARLRRAMEKLRGFLSSKGHKAGPAMILALLWRDGCQPASASLCARLDSVLPGRPCALIEPVAPQGQVNGKEFLRMGNGALVKAALATVAAVALVAAAWRVNRGAGRVERGTGILPVTHGQDGRATAGSAELGSGTKSGLGTSNTDPRATLSEPLTANPAPSSPNPTPPGDVTASVRQIEARKAEKTAAHSREAASRVEWQQGEIHVLTEPAPGERSVRTIEVAPGAGARR